MSPHPLELLSAYLDGELDAGRQDVVIAHLQACPACVARLAELAAIDRGARSLEVMAPEGYFDDFGDRVRTRLGRPQRRPAAPWWWAAAAAALLVGAITPLLLRQPELQAPAVVAPPAPLPDAPGVGANAQPRNQVAGEAEVVDGLVDQAAAEKKETAERVGGRTPDAIPERAFDSSARAEATRAKSKLAEVAPRRAPQPAEPSDAPADTEGRLDSPRQGAGATAPAAAPPPPPALGFAQAPREQQKKDHDAVPGAPPPTLASAAEARDEERPAAPAAAPLPAPATADKAQQAKRGRAATGSAARAEPDRYAELLTRQPGSRDEARALREAWRALVEDGLDPARADEARVRVIRSGLAAYRLGGSPDDLLQLQSDAALYLARADARQRERVREWLRGLPSESDH